VLECRTVTDVSEKRTASLFRDKKRENKRSISCDQLIRNESRPTKEHMKGTKRKQICPD